MDIIEKFTTSKREDQHHNEDAIYISEEIVAVIDGATSKTPMPPNAPVKSGVFASSILCEALSMGIEYNSPLEMLEYMNRYLKDAVSASVYKDCLEPPSAVIVMFDARRNRIVRYGDCPFSINGKVYRRDKEIDRKCAEKRAGILKELLGSVKADIATLQENDVGRKAIESDLLEMFFKYANADELYGFPVLGIGEIKHRFVEIVDVPAYSEIILASDGYPILKPTLESSEMELKALIKQDPLRIGDYKSTKGVANDCVSFDDRTYIRFKN